jgi:Domain of unknown function (DUF4326)
MTRPVRLQLSRRKGFNLQALSLTTNGLPAVNVARPTKYGNPHKVAPISQIEAVRRFRCDFSEIDQDRIGARVLKASVGALRGKNVACWCSLTEPCHGDVWLEFANRESAP